MDDLVIVIDKDRTIVDYYQPLDANHSGFMVEEFLNLPMNKTGLPPQITNCFEQAMNILERSPQVQEFDFKFEQPSGTEWYSAKMSCRMNRKGDVVGFTVVARNITERLQDEQRILTLAEHLEKANLQLTKLAISDPLTGLKNRRFFFEELIKLVTLAKRKGWPICLLVIDVDNFKVFNDRFGHPAGDKILIELTQIIEKTTRESDLIARYGGEEFLVALTDTKPENAQAIGERIRAAVETYPFPQGEITISIGISTYSPSGDQGESIQNQVNMLFAEADRALYTSKRLGRNKVTLVSD
jgi:diguanylate cyclase (GGDEF)-like protein/PAS domain S-box-containing protein